MMQTQNFEFIGNNIALDFVNTCVCVNGVEIDLLKTPEHFSEWLNSAGLESVGEVSETDLKTAKQLRQSIKALAARPTAQSTDLESAIAFLNAFIVQPDKDKQLVMTAEAYEFHVETKKQTVRICLEIIAVEAANMFVETPLKRIKQCANPACILTFKDTSKSGRRKWCSMDVCGNRAKVATHYKRTALNEGA